MVQNEITLRPTGKCFDHALDELQRLIKENPDRRHNREFKLVHGLVMYDFKEAFAHAWLETDKECIDFAIVSGGEHDGEICRYTVEKSEYYQYLDVIDCTRYDVEEVWRLNSYFGTFGPWEEKYLSRTKDKGKKS